MKTIYHLLGAFVLTCGIAQADLIVTLTLNPANGALSGAAGSSTGWGFTLSTNSDYVTIESFTFGDLTPVGLFSTPGVPSTVASSGSPITTPWIPGIAGLQYDISNSATSGASTQGVMTVIYDAYTDAGLTNQIVFGDSVNAQFDGQDVNASVTVTGPAPVTTPEPGSRLLTALGLVMLGRLLIAPRKMPVG